MESQSFNTSQLAAGIVFQENGRAMTTSLIVAREFGKDHRNVLRDIRALLEGGMLKNEQAPMFVESEYTNEQNGQSYPMYHMNRDGFTLLAMGFTGERALEFKMKFLQAFGAMEKMLTSDEYILMRSQQIMRRLNEQLNQRVQMLEGEKELLMQENKELAPKAEYTDKVLQSTGNSTFSEVAKELKMRSADALIKKLLDRKIIFKRGKRYLPFAKYSELGYFDSRTHHFFHADGRPDTSLTTVVTEKGRMWLHGMFNSALKPIDLFDI